MKPEAPPATVSRAEFLNLFLAVFLPMFLAAVDQTLLATATPAIAATLGGLRDTSWIAVGYLLAAATVVPVYGRMGDLRGRREMLFVALSIFAAGSLACGLAQSLPQLLAARVLQGLGGGGLMTLSQALIGELVPPRERARFQGYFAAMFATASTAGPVLGGVLTQYLSWRAVFLINLPLGGVAAFLAMRIPRHPVDHPAPFHADIVGTLLFAIGTVSLLFGLSSAGHRFPFADWRLYGVIAFAIATLAGFVAWEKRIADPVVPVRLLSQPVILRSNTVVMCFAAALFASILYTPLYLQLGRGFAIGTSGLLLLPLTLSTATAALITGRLIARTGELTRYPKRGLLLSTVAFAALALTVHGAPTWIVLALLMLAGGGLGCVMPSTQIIVQEAGGRAALARAVASMAVSRAIGGAVGVAVVGALVFVLVGRHDTELARLLPQIAESGGTFLEALPEAQRATIASHLDYAFEVVFFLIAAITAIGATLASRVPTQRLAR